MGVECTNRGVLYKMPEATVDVCINHFLAHTAGKCSRCEDIAQEAKHWSPYQKGVDAILKAEDQRVLSALKEMIFKEDVKAFGKAWFGLPNGRAMGPYSAHRLYSESSKSETIAVTDADVLQRTGMTGYYWTEIVSRNEDGTIPVGKWVFETGTRFDVIEEITR